MNIKWEFQELFDQACFLMSLPFILMALILSGFTWLFHKIAITLCPDWADSVERETHKETEP